MVPHELIGELESLDEVVRVGRREASPAGGGVPDDLSEDVDGVLGGLHCDVFHHVCVLDVGEEVPAKIDPEDVVKEKACE